MKTNKTYECVTCRDIGIVKKGVGIAYFYAYPGGDKVMMISEEMITWDFEDCPMCGHKDKGNYKRGGYNLYPPFIKG